MAESRRPLTPINGEFGPESGRSDAIFGADAKVSNRPNSEVSRNPLIANIQAAAYLEEKN